MAIILRQVTGSALSFAQVDTNFSAFYYSSSVAGASLTLFRTGSDAYGIPITSESISIAGVNLWTASLDGTITRDSNARITGSFNQGIFNKVSGNYAHAEGRLTTASGDFSHAEGHFTEASATGSHAEGYFTDSTGNYSHAEGDNTQASGWASHAEGKSTVASATGSHAEGESTSASGPSSHAEGYLTVASGSYSHAEGLSTIARAIGSHAEGTFTTASGDYSHAEGYFTVASGSYQHVQGQYNLSSSAQSAFIVGNGTSGTNRSNLIFASGSQVQVTGSLRVQGSITGSLFGTASSALTASYAMNVVASLPGGTFDSIQINKNGAFAGSPNLKFDTVTNIATLVGSLNNGSSTQAIGPFSHAEGISTTSRGNYSHTEGASTNAIGVGAHAEGVSTTATGNYSHAEGNTAQAIGPNSHAEGYYGQAGGNASHAEGYYTYSTGDYSHAEGHETEAIGQFSHAEGGTAQALGNHSHAEGDTTVAYGDYSHAEGKSTIASGSHSHTEGRFTRASGSYSHAEGTNTLALGSYSHAEGFYTTASGQASHAEGRITRASGDYSHAEGDLTRASGSHSHAEGIGTLAQGNFSHAEGYYTQATGLYSHAEGQYAYSIGDYSHTEGNNTQALGFASHAEGYLTVASGYYSHAEGLSTIARAIGSHAEGATTLAKGDYSHAEGTFTTASGDYSHAEGYLTKAIGNYSHAEGNRGFAGTDKAYQVGGIVAGLVILSNTYADITSQFTAGGLLLFQDYGGTYGKAVYRVANSSYLAPNTRIQLVDTGINNSSGGYVGSLSYGAVDWTGNVVFGGVSSHAEGTGSVALGEASHAEGFGTQTVGDLSHTEGLRTITVGIGSHAEGSGSLALGTGSHAEGLGTVAQGHYQHVQGQYNLSSSAQSAFIVGNGLTNTNRSNLIFASGSQVQITGSLNVGGGITGSLLGTASFASTASYILNAPGVNLPGGLSTTIQFNKAGAFSGSANLTYIDSTNTVQLTGSLTTGLSTIASALYQNVAGQFNQSSSVQSVFIVGNGISNTNRRNLIFASGSEVQVTGSLKVNGSITGSLLGTASYVTGSIFTGANPVLSASYAISSSYILQAVSASFSTTASYALNAGGATTPQGAANTIQFNKAGVFSGSANLTYIDSINKLRISGSLDVSGSLNLSGSNANIIFSDSATSKRGIQGTIGGSDHWFIGGGATLSDTGFLEIATGDNGHQSGLAEPIYVSQYGPTSPLLGSTPSTQATLLDRNGNTFFPGNFTVSKSLSANSTAITGSLVVSGSTTVDDILILTPRITTPTPANTVTGSIMLSGSSGANLNLYIYTGTGAIGNGWSKITIS